MIRMPALDAHQSGTRFSTPLSTASAPVHTSVSRPVGITASEVGCHPDAPACPLSTIAGAESTGGSAPSWVSMVRAAAACGCVISASSADQDDVRLGPWPFDGVRDQGARHLPAHLDVWRLGRTSEWSSSHKYSVTRIRRLPPIRSSAGRGVELSGRSDARATESPQLSRARRAGRAAPGCPAPRRREAGRR